MHGERAHVVPQTAAAIVVETSIGSWVRREVIAAHVTVRTGRVRVDAPSVGQPLHRLRNAVIINADIANE